MNKNEAIKIINKRLGEPLLNNRNTHFANVNSAKSVWWFDIPTKKALSIEIDHIHLLIFEPKGNELLFLKVPTRFFIQNRSGFVIREGKGTISLELSCEKETFLKDIRPTSEQISFLEFVQ